MAVTWITPTAVTPPGTSGWQDADLSALIPAGSTGVILEVVVVNATFAGARKNGDSTNLSGFVTNMHFWMPCGVDANGLCELYRTDTTLSYVLHGAFGSESVFFTSAISKTPSAGSWQDIDISSDTGGDTATVALWAVFQSFDSSAWGLRQNGSSDSRTLGSMFGYSGFAVGVDGSEICEGYRSGTGVSMFLVGYMTSAVTALTNATDLSLDTTEAYTDLAALPTGATGGFIEVTATDSYSFDLRENGASDETYMIERKHAFGMVECDDAQLIEGKIQGYSDIGFWLTGYTTAGEEPGPTVQPYYYHQNQ